ncbi:hypothetical protein [Actinomadura parmotrematis]|uniref:Sigma-70 family RNA polymerase sigma factor n=1 Tax=Actinomadura parmotrematis TaxID=2864039 RepID=A0ABS7G659_9ACTN|nr:hypothetical protein [Actinomadura parmotrematis]MBW8487287.1 hypothetical protein [Actinomadura parmotrematis]
MPDRDICPPFPLPTPATVSALTFVPSLLWSERCFGNAIEQVAHAFRLLTTGPAPLSLDLTPLGHGLPCQVMGLHELEGLLLRRAGGTTADGEAIDAVWRALVQHARTGKAAWVIGCFGVALPGLRRAAARAVRGCDRDTTADITAEMVTAFVAALATVDLDRPGIISRLVWSARHAANRTRQRLTREHVFDPTDPDDPVTGELLRAPAPHEPTPAEAHRHDTEIDPSAAIADAVELGVLTRHEADLITVTRLGKVNVTDLAKRLEVPRRRLYGQRERAEARLAAAILDGQVPVKPGGRGGNRASAPSSTC